MLSGHHRDVYRQSSSFRPKAKVTIYKARKKGSAERAFSAGGLRCLPVTAQITDSEAGKARVFFGLELSRIFLSCSKTVVGLEGYFVKVSGIQSPKGKSTEGNVHEEKTFSSNKLVSRPFFSPLSPSILRQQKGEGDGGLEEEEEGA